MSAIMNFTRVWPLRDEPGHTEFRIAKDMVDKSGHKLAPALRQILTTLFRWLPNGVHKGLAILAEIMTTQFQGCPIAPRLNQLRGMVVDLPRQSEVWQPGDVVAHVSGRDQCWALVEHVGIALPEGLVCLTGPRILPLHLHQLSATVASPPPAGTAAFVVSEDRIEVLVSSGSSKTHAAKLFRENNGRLVRMKSSNNEQAPMLMLGAQECRDLFGRLLAKRVWQRMSNSKRRPNATICLKPFPQPTYLALFGDLESYKGTLALASPPCIEVLPPLLTLPCILAVPCTGAERIRVDQNDFSRRVMEPAGIAGKFF
jgi:hypothetical protein